MPKLLSRPQSWLRVKLRARVWVGVGASRAQHVSERYGAAARLSKVTALPLSPSHSLVMPSVVYVPRPSTSRPQSWLLINL